MRGRGDAEGPRRRGRGAAARRVHAIGFHVLLWSLVALVLAPIAWQVSIALGVSSREIPGPDALGTVSLDALRSTLELLDLTRWVLYGTTATTAGVVLAVVLGFPVAFALARQQGSSRRLTAGLLLFAHAVPTVLYAVAGFDLVRRHGLEGDLVVVLLAYLATLLPLTVWLLVGFLDRIPADLEEAALVQGATRVGAVRHVTLPLAAPGVIATVVVAWLFTWSDSLLLTVVASSGGAMSVPEGLLQDMGLFIGRPHIRSTIAVVATLPPLLLVVLLQHYVRYGLEERFTRP